MRSMTDTSSFAVSPQKKLVIVWTLLSLIPIIGMAIDLIAPSLPAIASGLKISNELTKNIISIYIVGYALGNFITGFLADALGRQKLLRLSLLAFIIISLLPIFFPRIDILLLVRFLQGLTLGAVAVLARTVFSDILSPEELVRIGTLMGTMYGIGPVIGPVIGGYLQYYFGWQAGFYFFAFVALIGFIPVFFIIPETLIVRYPLNIKTIMQNSMEVLSHRMFIGITILMGLAYSLIISFNTAGPFLIQTTLGFSSVFFGHIALWLGLGFLAATFICRYLLKIYNVDKLYIFIMNGAFLVSILAVAISYFFDKSIIFISTISILMYFTCGFIFPMSMGKGMSLFRHISGTAAATMYLINMLITSLIGFIVSFIEVKSAIVLMWIYFIVLLMAMWVYRKFIR